MTTKSKLFKQWKKADADLRHIESLLKSQQISESAKSVLRAEHRKIVPSVEAIRQSAIAAPGCIIA